MLAVSRALGDRALKPVVSCLPFTTTTHLSSRDRFVLLASDGLWDVVDDAQAVQIAAELADGWPLSPAEQMAKDRAALPKAVAERLVQRALTLGSTDNVTVQVVWCVRETW